MARIEGFPGEGSFVAPAAFLWGFPRPRLPKVFIKGTGRGTECPQGKTLLGIGGERKHPAL